MTYFTTFFLEDTVKAGEGSATPVILKAILCSLISQINNLSTRVLTERDAVAVACTEQGLGLDGIQDLVQIKHSYLTKFPTLMQLCKRGIPFCGGVACSHRGLLKVNLLPYFRVALCGCFGAGKVVRIGLSMTLTYVISNSFSHSSGG